MPKTNSILAVALSITCVSIISGCSSRQMSDIDALISGLDDVKSPRIAPPPEFDVIPSFSYDADYARDPFVVADSQSENGNHASQGTPSGISSNRPKEPLEMFPLDTLRMVGTVSAGNDQWGLVMASDGAVYRVEKGNYIGMNYGRIESITESGMEIIEIIPDNSGGWVERKAGVSING